jgi:hypothetical protein
VNLSFTSSPFIEDISSSVIGMLSAVAMSSLLGDVFSDIFRLRALYSDELKIF